MGKTPAKPPQDPTDMDFVLRHALPASNADVEDRRMQSVVDKASRRAGAPSMQLKLKDGGILEVKVPHAERDTAGLLLMADLGTCDPDFVAGIVNQVATFGASGRQVDETASNFLLSVSRAVEPRDELEAMLALQMGAIHSAVMSMAARMDAASTLPQQEVTERSLNRLARTFATQLEALKRYRTGGEQRVLVEHVTVNAGGQAIVGAVTTGGGGGTKE